MSIGKPAPKKAVALICSAFAQAQLREGGLRMKDAYNLLATLEGFKSWSHYKSHLATQKEAGQQPVFGVLSAAIADWPRFVFFEGVDEVGEELQFMLPPGSNFDNRMNNTAAAWKPFRDEGAKPVPDLLKHVPQEQQGDFLRRHFVATQTFVEIPRIDRYGVPSYATQAGVAQWLEDTYGYNYLVFTQNGDPQKQCLVEVHVDEGDDGRGAVFLEVAVEPVLAARLVALFEETPAPDWL